MNILQKIVENTRDNLKVQKTNLSLEEIKSSLAELSLPKSNFKSSISNKNEASNSCSSFCKSNLFRNNL